MKINSLGPTLLAESLCNEVFYPNLVKDDGDRNKCLHAYRGGEERQDTIHMQKPIIIRSHASWEHYWSISLLCEVNFSSLASENQSCPIWLLADQIWTTWLLVLRRGYAENYPSIPHHLLSNHSHSTSRLNQDGIEIMTFPTPHSYPNAKARHHPGLASLLWNISLLFSSFCSIWFRRMTSLQGSFPMPSVPAE